MRQKHLTSCVTLQPPCTTCGRSLPAVGVASGCIAQGEEFEENEGHENADPSREGHEDNDRHQDDLAHGDETEESFAIRLQLRHHAIEEGRPSPAANVKQFAILCPGLQQGEHEDREESDCKRRMMLIRRIEERKEVNRSIELIQLSNNFEISSFLHFYSHRRNTKKVSACQR